MPVYSTTERIEVKSYSNNRYRINWKHFWMIENTDCIITKAEPGFLGFTRWVEVARIRYTERVRSDNSTSMKITSALFDLMREDEQYRNVSTEIGNLDNVVHLIATALKYNDDLTLQVVREFDNCSPHMQLQAIFALETIIEKEKEALENMAFNNDYSMHSKLNMIEQHYNILKELPTSY